VPRRSSLDHEEGAMNFETSTRRPVPGRERRFWLNLTLGCACLAFLAAFLFFPITAGEIPRYGPICMSNLKQLALADLAYQADYDDRLPDSQFWMDRLVPYAKNEDLYHCPDVKKTNPKAYGYAMNYELSRRRGNDVAKPEIAPLVFDSVLLVRNATSGFYGFPDPPRHSGNNVAYLDGHVERISK
jgi:prepilin-type processing-associated H-X9-DG protein